MNDSAKGGGKLRPSSGQCPRVPLKVGTYVSVCISSKEQVSVDEGRPEPWNQLPFAILVSGTAVMLADAVSFQWIEVCHDVSCDIDDQKYAKYDVFGVILNRRVA